MSFLRTLLASSVTDERYWTPTYGAVTAAGMRVGPESALKVSTVWACDRLLSETIASLPAITYELLADGGRKRATNHPLYDVLKRAPNAKQTAFEFYDFMTHCAILRGNAYARIIPGPRGFADQLDPLHPDWVQPERLVDGRLRYKVREPGKEPAVYTDEDILHVRGPSFDGTLGVSVVTYARESMGLALAAERYGGRFFSNNTMPGGVLQAKGKLSNEGAARLKAEWEALHAGDNAHRVAVLEEGMSWQAVGLNNKDSQFLETREFQAEDICRWFRVPPHMVGLTSKVTSWGSGIEQLGLGFVTYTLMPWLVRWQQAITRDLILAPDKYFVEFLVDALLKGDLASRYSAYAIGRDKGWLSVNDVRRSENMNPVPGGDAYQVTSAPAARPPVEPDEDDPEDEPASAPAQDDSAAPDAHYRGLLQAAAARVVRKEMLAMSRAARRLEADMAAGAVAGTGAWPALVQAFYATHAPYVAQTMCISAEIAEQYVAEQRADLLARGPAAIESWEPARVAHLVGLAQEERS